MPQIRDLKQFHRALRRPEEDKAATAEASANMIEAGWDDASLQEAQVQGFEAWQSG